MGRRPWYIYLMLGSLGWFSMHRDYRSYGLPSCRERAGRNEVQEMLPHLNLWSCVEMCMCMITWCGVAGTQVVLTSMCGLSLCSKNEWGMINMECSEVTPPDI